MHVIRAAEGESREVSSQATFEGGAVWRRNLTEPDVDGGKNITVAMVQFAAGARTKFHRHTSDQILYIISGIGRVGTREHTHTVASGDCVVIPSQEDHWHGAGDTGSPMSHLAILGTDSQTIISDD